MPDPAANGRAGCVERRVPDRELAIDGWSGRAMKFSSSVNPIAPSCAPVEYWRSNKLLIWPITCSHRVRR